MAKKEPFTSSSSSGDDARERPSESVSSSERPDALREAEADEGKAAGRPEDKTLPPPKERVKGANEADEAQWILIFRQTAGTYKAPEEWLKSFGQPMDENYRCFCLRRCTTMIFYIVRRILILQKKTNYIPSVSRILLII